MRTTMNSLTTRTTSCLHGKDADMTDEEREVAMEKALTSMLKILEHITVKIKVSPQLLLRDWPSIR
jgi:hypothetical protein